MANEVTLNPHHKSIVPELENGTREEVVGFLRLLETTIVPKNHDAIIIAVNTAIDKHGLQLVAYGNLVIKLVKERAEAEKKAAEGKAEAEGGKTEEDPKIWDKALKDSTGHSGDSDGDGKFELAEGMPRDSMTA